MRFYKKIKRLAKRVLLAFLNKQTIPTDRIDWSVNYGIDSTTS